MAQGRQIVRARISSSFPDGIPGVLISDKQFVKLQPLLLNPNDSLTLAIITSGGQPKFMPQARIAGISRVLYEDTTIKKGGWKLASFLFPIAVLAMVFYMVAAAFLIRPGTMLISRTIAFFAMLIFMTASNLAIHHAYRAIEIEESVFNIAMFALVSAIIATPMYFRQVRISRTRKI